MDVVRNSRLGWLGHLERKAAGDCVNTIQIQEQKNHPGGFIYVAFSYTLTIMDSMSVAGLRSRWPCRNMANVGNAGKGKMKKGRNEVVKDDLK